ncbi:hypothetical protein BDV35DRAFT_374850, partial [Aspergillus flavus]
MTISQKQLNMPLPPLPTLPSLAPQLCHWLDRRTVPIYIMEVPIDAPMPRKSQCYELKLQRQEAGRKRNHGAYYLSWWKGGFGRAASTPVHIQLQTFTRSRL